MSICNVWTSEQTGIVAVDTACIRRPGDIRCEFSKLLHIPHVNTALAFRGENLTAAAIYLQTIASPAASYDDVLSRIPDAFRAIERDRVGVELPEGVELHLELFVLGWSDRLDRMAIARYWYDPGKELDYIDPDNLGSMLSPCRDKETEARGLEVPFQETDDLAGDIRALVEDQIAYGRETNPDVAFGGRLLVAMLDRYSARIMDLGALA